MDVNELMAYKPSQAPKRPAPQDPVDELPMEEEEVGDDPNDSYEARAKKRKLARKKAMAIAMRAQEEERLAMLEEEARQAKNQQDGINNEQRNRINSIVEQGANLDSVTMDEQGIKKTLLTFEKKTTRNQELRIKFPDQPEKFMESEMELNDAVQDMKAVATVPSLYPVLVDLNVVPSILGLLNHDNTDISVGVVDLLQELTDVDTLTESEDGANALIEALVERQVCSLLVNNLDRLDESVKEEAEGVHNTLAILENIVEFQPEMSKDIAEAGFMAWLIKKLKVKVPFDDNKLYASEVLSILLQNEPANRLLFGNMDAMDSMLQQLAYYKRHDPAVAEEVELMENLFDCLCSLMLEVTNRERFLKGEGLQLMNLMLREKKKSRSGALKVLSHALTGAEGIDNCLKFIDILGLRTLFPLFMKTPKRSKRAGVSAEEHEDHVISILASLFKNVTSTNNGLKQRERLLAKWTENDHEKVDRLMEVHDKYLAKVEESDKAIDKEVRMMAKDPEQEPLSDEEIYMKRLEGGLFCLQQVDYIILEICSCGASTVKQRVLQILSLRGGSLKTVRDVVREYAGNLGEEGEEHEKRGEQDYLVSLVDKF